MFRFIFQKVADVFTFSRKSKTNIKQTPKESEMLIFIGKQTFPETCYYCGKSLHPMPRYVRGHEITTICNIRFALVDGEPTLVPSECHEKALAEGWEKRPDLTPLR